VETEKVVKLSSLHEGQLRVVEEAKRFNVLCCGRRWGKSELAIDILCDTALDGLPLGYFTPTYKLLDGVYNECLSILEPVIVRKNEHKFIEVTGGGRIEFWSMENELAGRSRKYKKVVVDECAFTKNLWKIWTESIRPTLTDLKGGAWFMSTPKGRNDFYDLFLKGKNNEPGWASWQMSTYTNPYMDKTEIDEAKKDLPEVAFRQEYLAEFAENAANPFGLQYIRQCVYPLSTHPAVCYGIDLAKSFDYTVIIGLDKFGSVCHFDRFQKDWKQTIETILLLPNVPIQIDSTGVGDPIAETVQSRRGNVSGFKFSAFSKQQLMEGLAVAIQQRRVNFPDGLIVDELDNFEYEFTRTGVRYSAPKGHDDCVCALALAVDLHKTAVHSGQYSWA
jgi:hypothetical protein